MSLIRVQKILADAGICSRREAERRIEMGEITINGKIAKLGDRADPEQDHIKVEGKLLQRSQRKYVLAVFKPRGLLSRRPAAQLVERDTVFDLLDRRIKETLMVVGQLDTDSEGVLLLTSDRELAARLNHQKYEVPRTYEVKIDGSLDERQMKRLKAGLKIEDRRIRPIDVHSLRKTEGKEWIQITVSDTRNRNIRKLFEEVGHPVDKVRRSKFAHISLKNLKRGGFRQLDVDEVKGLLELVGLDSPASKSPRR